jgi:hypothetical protein
MELPVPTVVPAPQSPIHYMAVLADSQPSTTFTSSESLCLSPGSDSQTSLSTFTSALKQRRKQALPIRSPTTSTCLSSSSESDGIFFVFRYSSDSSLCLDVLKGPDSILQKQLSGLSSNLCAETATTMICEKTDGKTFRSRIRRERTPTSKDEINGKQDAGEYSSRTKSFCLSKIAPSRRYATFCYEHKPQAHPYPRRYRDSMDDSIQSVFSMVTQQNVLTQEASISAAKSPTSRPKDSKKKSQFQRSQSSHRVSADFSNRSPSSSRDWHHDSADSSTSPSVSGSPILHTAEIQGRQRVTPLFTSASSPPICSSPVIPTTTTKQRSFTHRAHDARRCSSCDCPGKNTPNWREAKPEWGEGYEKILMCNACGLRYWKYRVHCRGCQWVPFTHQKRLSECPKCGDGDGWATGSGMTT